MTTRYTADYPLESLPESWQKHILRLRAESARHRRERNARQRDLEAADVRILELEAELAELKSARADG